MRPNTPDQWIEAIEIYKNTANFDKFVRAIGESRNVARSIYERIQTASYPINGIEEVKPKQPTDRYIPVLKAMVSNSLEETAKMLGVSKSRADQLYKKYGIQRTDSVHRDRILMITTIDKIKSVASLGISIRKSAEQLGLTKAQYKFALKEFGLERALVKATWTKEKRREYAKNNYIKNRGELFVVEKDDGSMILRETGPDIKCVSFDNDSPTYMTVWTGHIDKARVFLITQRQTMSRLLGIKFKFKKVTDELLSMFNDEDIINRITMYGKPFANSGQDTANFLQALSARRRQANITPKDSGAVRAIPIDGPESVPSQVVGQG